VEKDLFADIQLFFGKSNHRIRSIELIDKSGDKINIMLSNVQVNTIIDDKVFTQ
jgi:outer membrane lipoprotein-sorting protein